MSKVRSLALDFWNPEHVELMKCIGNERSWTIFEGDDCDEGLRRPSADSNQKEMEQWIMAKYGSRKFVQFSGSPDLSEDDRLEFIRTVKPANYNEDYI